MLADLKHSNLNLAQIYTLNSYKELNGKGLIELNYTADYKVDELIKKLSEQNTFYADDTRAAIKSVVAPNSSMDIPVRLSNKNAGCSSAIAQDDESGAWLLGRNYDLDIRSNGTTVVVHTAPKNGYKSVGTADMAQFGLGQNNFEANKELLLYSPYVTMDGVNEKGFAISIMLLNYGRVIQDEPNKDSLPSTLLVRYLLDNADSVDSAIKLLNEMNLKPDYLISTKQSQDRIGDNVSYHWAMTDASGDRAIIEYTNGKMNVIENPVHVDYDEANLNIALSYPNIAKPYLISTNFHLSPDIDVDLSKIDSGFWRYATLEKALEKNPTPNENELAEMMKSAKYYQNDFDMKRIIKQEGKDVNDPNSWDWITIWTDILNTSTKTMRLFSKEDYTKEYDFGMDGSAAGALISPLEAQQLTALIAKIAGDPELF